MRLICGDDGVHVGADAVYEIARRLPVCRWVAWIYRVPILHAVLPSAYGWVAANRGRLSGSGPVCVECKDGEA
jgi:predicted DCC family thiol-disulfide oxidoreductase YuxK